MAAMLHRAAEAEEEEEQQQEVRTTVSTHVMRTMLTKMHPWLAGSSGFHSNCRVGERWYRRQGERATPFDVLRACIAHSRNRPTDIDDTIRCMTL